MCLPLYYIHSIPEVFSRPTHCSRSNTTYMSWTICSQRWFLFWSHAISFTLIFIIFWKTWQQSFFNCLVFSLLKYDVKIVISNTYIVDIPPSALFERAYCLIERTLAIPQSRFWTNTSHVTSNLQRPYKIAILHISYFWGTDTLPLKSSITLNWLKF